MCDVPMSIKPDHRDTMAGRSRGVNPRVLLQKLARRSIERRHRKMAELAVGPHILDIGYAEAPNRFLCSKGHVVGIDLAKVEGPAGYDEVVQASVADAAGILEGRRFDTILMGEVIEHLEAPYSVLRSLSSLMHDNSRLIMSTPNPASFPVLLFELLRSKRFFYTRQHLYYFLPRWVERMLDASGYSLREVVQTGLFHLPIPVPKVLSYILIYVATKKTY